MHDNSDPQWGSGQSAPQAPSGLRATLPSQPTRTRAEPTGAPWYQQQDQAAADAWSHGDRADGRVVEYGGVDAEKRTEGVKNIIGGAVLIGIGFAFGGSVFLGNPEPYDYFFDGLGTLWILKGFWDLFAA